FALAGLLAVAFSPLAARLERRWRIPSWVSAVLALLLVGVAAALLGLVAYLGFAEVMTALPEYTSRVTAAIDGVRGQLGLGAGEGLDLSSKEVRSGLLSGESIKFVRSVAGSSFGFLSGVALTLLFLLFFVASRRNLAGKLHGLLVSQGFDRGAADETMAAVTEKITRYLWLKTAISAVTGGLFGLAAWIGGTPFPIFWGFIAFSFNYAPSLGPIVASVVPIGLTLLVVEPLPTAIGVSVVLAAIQLISGSIVEPKILGDELDLNIVTVFLSLLFWGLVWGPVGMLLGVPLTALIQLILRCSPRAEPIAELMGS
ncbi:MAG: AI-2E family transporter, partial [Myxococcales bacterium]|nr:AI-2E family transporter [Myxococcales bacterium]